MTLRNANTAGRDLDNKITYSDFMLGMTNAPMDFSMCAVCGGTGFRPVMCCDGFECGCRGMPVDFDKCSNCESTSASDEKIISWIPKRGAI